MELDLIDFLSGLYSGPKLRRARLMILAAALGGFIPLLYDSITFSCSLWLVLNLVLPAWASMIVLEDLLHIGSKSRIRIGLVTGAVVGGAAAITSATTDLVNFYFLSSRSQASILGGPPSTAEIVALLLTLMLGEALLSLLKVLGSAGAGAFAAAFENKRRPAERAHSVKTTTSK
jgi:hypothetical protein